MPIPTTVCSVCNQKVNKAQTRSIGAGKRACKYHDGVAEQAAQALQAVQEEHEVGRARPEKRDDDYEDYMPVLGAPTCFFCCSEGVRYPDFLLGMLECGNLYRKKHGKHLNPFSPEECKEAYAPLQGLNVLFYCAYEHNMSKLMSHHAAMAADMAGFALACSKCCDKHKLKKYDASENKPLPSLEDLHLLVGIVEESLSFNS